MKHKSKIIYLTFGEILNAPLLRRQIIELLCEIHKLDSDLRITVLSVLPVHTYINHIKDNREVRRLFAEQNIKFRVIPTIVPCPLPNIGLMKTDKGYRPDMRWTKWATRFLGVTLFPVLTYYYLIQGVRLFHCRSYPSSYASVIFSRFFKSCKVIFDPRSDFPEENITSGSWERDSRDFIFWKSAEKNMLEKSAAVACIYPSQMSEYKKDALSVNGFLVPNNVDCNNFKRNVTSRNVIRKKLMFSENDSVLCYLGDITSGGWHRADIYVKAYQSLSKLNQSLQFLFIVPQVGGAILREAFLNIGADNITIVSPDYSDVPLYLSAADYGLMFLHKQKNAVGTKVGEYLAAGLPVLTNKNCLGAVDVIEQHSAGYVIGINAGDLDDAEDLSMVGQLKTESELHDWSRQVAQFSEQYFDNKVIANAYYQQYLNLLE